MFVKFLLPCHFRLSNNRTDEPSAGRADKGLFTKPPIHWQMKPLEYIGPDLFYLMPRAHPDDADLYLKLLFLSNTRNRVQIKKSDCIWRDQKTEILTKIPYSRKRFSKGICGSIAVSIDTVSFFATI